jgi:hypothetical protein
MASIRASLQKPSLERAVAAKKSFTASRVASRSALRVVAQKQEQKVNSWEEAMAGSAYKAEHVGTG